jgi:hypothetical protein
MGRGDKGPGSPYSGEKRQWEHSRVVENMRGNGEIPIPDLMKKDQQPTK